MLEAAKIHLFITIILTQLSSILYNEIPYFPIEISRTAADGGVITKYIFNIGLISLIITLLFTNNINKETFVLWFGLSMIAYFDDKQHWVLHNIGVLILFLVAMFNAYKIGGESVLLVLLALSINTLRIGFRFLVVMYFEMNIGISYLWNHPQSTITEIFNLSKNIMYKGHLACNNPSVTIPFFKVSGVLQWVSFYVLSFIFK